MAARNSRPTSGASRANKNTQGAYKTTKTSPRGSRPKARRSATTGAKRSNYQKNGSMSAYGPPKKVKITPSPRTILSKKGLKARQQNSRKYKPSLGPN